MPTEPIETGIPIPPPGNGKGRVPRYPLRSMQVGDSFLVTDPSVSQTRLGSRLANFGKETGRKFAQRRTAEGIRVWRVE